MPLTEQKLAGADLSCFIERTQRVLATLEKSWNESYSKAEVARAITLKNEGVVLGTTLLAPCVQGHELQIHSLISFASGSVAPVTLIDTLLAAKRDRESGEVAMSAMRLALVVPTPATDAQSCRRIHFAAGLLEAGILSPSELLSLAGLALGESDVVVKYDPNQPRVAGGNREGGEWTSDGAGTPSAGRSALGGDGCAEEWNWAMKYCIDLLRSPNPSRNLTGGYKTPEGCAKGFVSQRCGGNKVI